MPATYFLKSLTAGLAVFALEGSFDLARAADVALAGRVTSEAEGAMEGVIVTAKQPQSIVSVSVVTDKDGRYSFPADHLQPGDYTLKIRAVGYDLDGAGKAAVAANGTATADLKLKKTRNLPGQLSNTDWLQSFPGTDEQKAQLLNCNGCHTYERIARSTHDVDEWKQVIVRMSGYANVAQPAKPQLRQAGPEMTPERAAKLAEFLASINLSSASQWEYPLKTRPRPTGAATREIVTTYDLKDPTIQPHDVVVDDQGTVWYTNFGDLDIGKFDPKSLELKKIALQEQKKGSPVGNLDLERDKNGTFWFDMMFQASVGHLDPKTGDIRYYHMPGQYDDAKAQLNFVGVNAIDGKVWTKNVGHQNVFRIDVKSGEWQEFTPLKELAGGPYSIYQVASDSENNLYFTEFQKNHIGRIDAKTGKVTFWETPTQNSRPRRLVVDDQDRMWFAEYRGNKVGMFDPKSEKISEFPIPTAWSNPYRPALDKNGDVWASTENSDTVVRIDPKTGATVEYLMPAETNMRSAFVDERGAKPTFWVGSAHGHALVKVETLD